MPHPLPCRYVVGIVFGFEHLLMVLALLLQCSINPVPKWVRVAIARREYLALKRVATTAAAREHRHAGREGEQDHTHPHCH